MDLRLAYRGPVKGLNEKVLGMKATPIAMTAEAVMIVPYLSGGELQGVLKSPEPGIQRLAVSVPACS